MFNHLSREISLVGWLAEEGGQLGRVVSSVG
jgi:hypothetical protein